MRTFIAICVCTAVMPWMMLRHVPLPVDVHDGFPGWPQQWDGSVLRELPLDASEEKYYADFPGRVAKFQAGSDILVLRWMHASTRRLHFVAECYRAVGFTVAAETPRKTENDASWARFRATKGGQQVLLEEQIRDNGGATWHDVSAWYWAAILGRSDGPWWAVTRVTDEPPL